MPSAYHVAALVLLAAQAGGAVGSEDEGRYDCPACPDSRGTGNFCGFDGECRPYSCAAYYEFGPRNATGYDEASPVPLECEDIPEATFGFSSAVLYRCYEIKPEPVKQGFTRKCHAQPSGPTTNFTCYEMAAGTEFQPFLDRVDQSGLTCADAPDEEGPPTFSYMVTISYTYVDDDGGKGSVISFAPGFNATAELNEEYALNGTMYTEYSVVPTPAPTPAPTPEPTPPPTSSSARSSKYGNVIAFGVCFGWIWQFI